MALIDDRYPRRYCLGLIEASERMTTTPRNTSYPRRYCLGLIEARLGGARGSSAEWYPRRYCLGLIEARTGALRLMHPVLRIRGVIASASLKRPVRVGCSGRCRRRIRGVIASASLKPQELSRNHHQTTNVSEALLPRPH